MPSPPICSTMAPTCGRGRCCWGIATCPPPRSTPISPVPACRSCTPSTTRGDEPACDALRRKGERPAMAGFEAATEVLRAAHFASRRAITSVHPPATHPRQAAARRLESAAQAGCGRLGPSSQECSMSVIRLLSGAALGLAASVALAADPDQAIRATLTKLQPDMPIEAIAESPMTGLYQVHLTGGRLLYASADGQFLMQGNLYQMKGDEAVNLTRQAESKG